MKSITDIKELTQGTKIVNLNYYGDVDYYKFLMVHPYNDEYVLLLDEVTQNAPKFYIPNIINCPSWQIDFTRKDILNYKREYYTRMLRLNDKRINDLENETRIL